MRQGSSEPYQALSRARPGGGCSARLGTPQSVGYSGPAMMDPWGMFRHCVPGEGDGMGLDPWMPLCSVNQRRQKHRSTEAGRRGRGTRPLAQKAQPRDSRVLHLSRRPRDASTMIPPVAVGRSATYHVRAERASPIAQRPLRNLLAAHYPFAALEGPRRRPGGGHPCRTLDRLVGLPVCPQSRQKVHDCRAPTYLHLARGNLYTAE